MSNLLDPSGTPALLHQTFTTNCLVVAISTLYIYDQILNIGLAAELLYLHRISAATLLYFVMHILTASYIIISIGTCFNLDCEVGFMILCSAVAYSIVPSVAVSSRTLLFSAVLRAAISIFILDSTYRGIICILYLLWGFISACRVYAINGRQRRLPLIIWSISVIPSVVNSMFVVQGKWRRAPAPVKCILYDELSVETQRRLLLFARPAMFILDAFVLYATLCATFDVKKWTDSLDVKGMSLASLLQRESTMYFCTTLTLNCVDMAKNYTTNRPNTNNFTDIFTTILLSHFLVHLRRNLESPAFIITDSARHSSLHFASRIIGDLAASLQTDSAGSREDDFDSYDERAAGQLESQDIAESELDVG